MKKSDAIELFGSGAALGRAVGLSRGRIAQWPERLSEDQTNRVIGAAVRQGLIRIESYKDNAKTIVTSIKPQHDMDNSHA